MITRSANTFLHRKRPLIRILLPVLSAVALLAASALAEADSSRGVADPSGSRIVFQNGASNAQPIGGETAAARSPGTALPDLGGDVVITEPHNAPARPSMSAAPVTSGLAANGPTQILVPGALVTMRF